LSDEAFHDVGFPSLPDAPADPGRPEGRRVLEDNIFNLRGSYADAGPGVPGQAPSDDAPLGAFRTPSLRNVTRTGPYGHDGALETLNDVFELHAPNVDQDQRGELLAFMQALNGDYPPAPWNNWPFRQ
jgi:cytochrome c peroxidase